MIKNQEVERAKKRDNINKRRIIMSNWSKNQTNKIILILNPTESKERIEKKKVK